MIEIFFGGLIFILFLLLCLGALIKFLPYKFQRLAFVVAAMLLLTPSWGPATIVAVPLPFGVLLCIGLFSGALHELPSLFALFVWWHVIAFTVTGLLSWLASIWLYKPRLNPNAQNT